MTRFINKAYSAELINLYHLARTALCEQRIVTRHDRMVWASKQFHILHPEVSSTGAYKDLNDLLQ